MNTEASTDYYLMEHLTEGARVRDKTDPGAVMSQLSTAGLKPGMRCLDVGCASGAATIEMARLAAPAEVIGTDFSEERLEEGRLLARESGVANVDFKRGSVYRLPFEDDTFDFVWARFVMEYLKDPVAAIAEMKRVAKPGGLVVAADLDGNCLFHYPIEPRLESALQKVMTLLGRTGFDPWVGRKLYSFYRKVGFSHISAHMSAHHVIAGEPSEKERSNWHEKVDTIVERMKDSFAGGEELAGLARGFKELIDSPDTFTYSPLIMIVGRK